MANAYRIRALSQDVTSFGGREEPSSSPAVRRPLEGTLVTLQFRSAGNVGGHDHELLEHLEQPELLLDRYLQEQEVSSSGQHNGGHRIPLGETDAFSPPPSIGDVFQVRCDKCGEEFSYKPEEILRVEETLPESFTPHLLFKDS